MSHILFNPWVGDRYHCAPLGKKVLILGESIYRWKSKSDIDTDKDVVINIITEQIDGYYKTKAFWTKIAMMFLNKKPTLEEKQKFWHSVAFHEYVQRTIGDKARMRPDEDQWTSGAVAFQEVLDSLQPEILVILGYSLWDHTPAAVAGPTLSYSKDAGTVIYKHIGGSCLAINVKHPSSGFNGRMWHPLIAEAMKIGMHSGENQSTSKNTAWTSVTR